MANKRKRSRSRHESNPADSSPASASSQDQINELEEVPQMNIVWKQPEDGGPRHWALDNPDPDGRQNNIVSRMTDGRCLVSTNQPQDLVNLAREIQRSTGTPSIEILIRSADPRSRQVDAEDPVTLPFGFDFGPSTGLAEEPRATPADEYEMNGDFEDPRDGLEPSSRDCPILRASRHATGRLPPERELYELNLTMGDASTLREPVIPQLPRPTGEFQHLEPPPRLEPRPEAEPDAQPLATP